MILCLVSSVPFLFLTAHACCSDMSVLLSLAIRWAEAMVTGEDGVVGREGQCETRRASVDINNKQAELLMLAHLSIVESPVASFWFQRT